MTGVADLAPRNGAWLTTVELCRATGASFRQLDYWKRTGLVAPAVDPGIGSGSRARYAVTQVRTVAALLELIHAGVSVETVRSYVWDFPRHDGDWLGALEFRTPYVYADVSLELHLAPRRPLRIVLDCQAIDEYAAGALVTLLPHRFSVLEMQGRRR